MLRFRNYKKKTEVQDALLSRLRDESSDLREQLGKAQDKCDVACQTARDFREYNIRLQQQLREVEAHLAMVLDARELEKDSHAAEQELVQQEQEQKHNELIKQVKLLQKKTHPLAWNKYIGEIPTPKQTAMQCCFH